MSTNKKSCASPDDQFDPLENLNKTLASSSLNTSTSSETMEVPSHWAPQSHARSFSVCKFEEDTSMASVHAMRAELDRLIALSLKQYNSDTQHPDHLRFVAEMEGFYRLFIRYLQTQSEGPLDWEKVNCPGVDLVVPYSKLPITHSIGNLSKLAVLKLNGGLGTTMGCTGPKSAIEVRDGMSFLDLTVRQIESLNTEHSTSVPLLLMDSFNTEAETLKIIKKYKNRSINIIPFKQSRFPRIKKDSLLPIPQSPNDSKNCWYPPGHGDVFESLNNSGCLDELISRGIEYIFISNIDNLGATVDPIILEHVIKIGSEFVMEVTDKTKADIKGGTIIEYNGHVRLLEIAQVPTAHKSDFTSIKKFRIFNTNNIWVSTRAIKRILNDNLMNLEVIVNNKIVEETGTKVIQLETAVGAAIKHFNGAQGVNVPRSRFLPVKSCSDLFLAQSDLYTLARGALVMNPKRQFGSTPLVKLGDHFKKVSQYMSRFASTPKILELDHLSVTGDVHFGKDVTLKGTVIIVANHGERIDIPSGSILDDNVVSGNLRILDH